MHEINLFCVKLHKLMTPLIRKHVTVSCLCVNNKMGEVFCCYLCFISSFSGTPLATGKAIIVQDTKQAPCAGLLM